MTSDRRQVPVSEVEATTAARTDELDRIARELAAKKAAGTIRRFDDLDAIREAARAH